MALDKKKCFVYQAYLVTLKILCVAQCCRVGDLISVYTFKNGRDWQVSLEHA